MGLVLFLILGACCGAVSVIALTFRSAASPKSAHPITAEWVEELSVDRYRPMLRLLDDRDVRALQRKPGIPQEKIAQFRHERCRVFQKYLKRLNADFSSVCLALKVVMLQSNVDRPDLAATLLRAQLRFALGMVSVQTRLILYELGIGSVDVTGLFRLFDTMRLELRSLTPESAVWGS
jgi:hypothetical protein